MLTQKILKKLLQHRGPVWHVKEEHVPGNDIVCPRCNGNGNYETSKSDCSYNSWTETETCHTCRGSGRATQKFSVVENNRWSFQVTAEGIELSYTLKDKDIFFSEAEAQAAARKLSRASRTKWSGKTKP